MTAAGVIAFQPRPMRQLGNALDPPQAHQHDDGRAVRREAVENRPIRVLGVTRDDDETRCHAPMGHRDAGERRRRRSPS